MFAIAEHPRPEIVSKGFQSVGSARQVILAKRRPERCRRGLRGTSDPLAAQSPQIRDFRTLVAGGLSKGTLLRYSPSSASLFGEKPTTIGIRLL